MWITSYMAKNIKNMRSACAGRISGADKGRVGFEGSSSHRALAQVAPYGIVSLPPVGERGVAARCEDSDVLLGVVMKDSGLEAGEIMLCSEGGASIVLKNNGDVIINGKVFGGQDGYTD